MLYELRVYVTVPGGLPAINARFANHTIGFFKRYDIGITGFWTDEIDRESLTVGMDVVVEHA